MTKRMTVVALTLSFLPVAVKATSIDIACWWEPYHSSNPADDTGLFYAKPNESLKLRIDPDNNTVSFPDPDSSDEIIFNNLSIVLLENQISVSSVQPNMRFIKGQRSVLKIFIDRYTMESFSTLALPDIKSGELQSRWLRNGKCVKKQL